MQANVGDQILMAVHGREQSAEVVEVRGADGEPPYLVRFPDGREQLVYPGPNDRVTPSA
ncbi:MULTISPECIES: DUF1918 domain-containing protein [unclassified Streptomyces]|uniref:DUF1918 domain-containing protein n=1 Tax=unclassified Streptomyces TaxID=2593676 RepID=UPI0036C46EDC